MATSTIKNTLIVRTASSDAASVNAGAGNDWYIPFSKFNSTGKPIGIAGFSLSGTGVSWFSIYRVYMDVASSRFEIAAKNTDSQARTITAYVNALFLE